MNSLLYYYNNVQKMAAYRQAKRMQRGTKLGYDEHPALGTTTKFVTPSIAIGTDDFSLEYYGNTYGGGVSTGRYNIYQAGVFSAGPTSIGQNGIYNISLGGESIGVSNFNLPDLEESFHLAVTRQGTTVKVYINGELKATKEQSEVKDLGDLQLAIANSSDVGFVRVWNYALSADEIATLYNNGDPMGYVVPKAMRELLSVNLIGSNSFTWDGSDSPYYYNITGNPITIGKYYKINVTVSDYQSGSPRIFAGISYPIPAQNGTFDIVVYNERYVNNFPIYGGSDGDPNRHLTITVNSITSVGLLAEYLPQNLMESRKESIGFTHFSTQNPYTFPGGVSKTMYCYLTRRYILGEGLKMRVKVSDYQSGVTTCVLGNVYHTIPSANGEYEFFSVSKLSPDDPASNYAMIYGSGAMTIEVLSIESVTVPTSWLDSAKQLPLSDECMEPLFQSIGGYDMAANGAPEILYNE